MNKFTIIKNEDIEKYLAPVDANDLIHLIERLRVSKACNSGSPDKNNMYQRLTARNKINMAYLVNVKNNEQVVESPYPNTLKCIIDCFERLAFYEDKEEQERLQRENDECDVVCGECTYCIDDDCDNSFSKRYGQCVDGISVECDLFMRR